MPTKFPAISVTDLPADIVLARLDALGLSVRGSNPWQAICPAHIDTAPSLSLTETPDGTLLIYCWGGCETEAVLEALDLDLGHLFPSLVAQQRHRRDRAAITSRKASIKPEIDSELLKERGAFWRHMLDCWRASRASLKPLARHLGVCCEALEALEVGFDRVRGAWVFPESTDDEVLVGLVHRYPDGHKRAMADSARGLTIPIYGRRLPHGPLYVAEGASDVAALFTAGALAYGRASAQGTHAQRIWLARLLKSSPRRQFIVLGDRDPSGTGQRGAKELAAYLSHKLERKVAWALPAKGFKDVREQITSGAWNKGIRIKD